MRIRVRRLASRAATVSVLALAASTGAALAQNTAVAAAGDQAQPAPDEIIVTARRRQESILRVPVVENVLTAPQLQKAQILNLNDLATRVPGLQIGTGPLSIGPQISVRGVGTSSSDAGIDQSISLNIDGLSLTQGLAYRAGVFDLAQAEVLKGPQALFFGKNSPAGVISLRSADPGDRVEVIGRLAYEGEAEEKRGELILSTPLTDTLGVRLAGSASFANGFFRDRAQNLTAAALGAAVPDVKFAPSRDFIVRGTVLWKPTSNFRARFKGNWTYDRVDGDAGQGQYSYCPEGVRTGPTGIRFMNPADNCKLDRTYYLVYLDPTAFPRARNGGVPFSGQEQKFGTLELNYTIDKIALTSITGYYHLDSNTSINAALTGFAAGPISADNSFQRHDVTQELRADTDFGGPINLTAGAFYQNGRIHNRIVLPVNRAILRLPLYPTGAISDGTHSLGIEAYSFFGQVRYKIVSTVELAGGVRWAHETRDDQVTNLNLATPVDISLPNRGRFSTSNFSPEATITWTPTGDLTFFAAAKKGYKSGSFTITTPVATPHFGDESVRGGEVGTKARLFDRQLSVNLAGYLYKYRGLQVGASVNDPVSGLPIVQTVNAAGARVYGVDFDFTFRPSAVPGLSFAGSANWNRARFTNFDNAQCTRGQTIAMGCNRQLNPVTGLYTAQDLTGLPLIRAPEWMLNGTIDYEMPVGRALKTRFEVAGQYSSSYITALSRGDQYVQHAYATIDANVALGSRNDAWELALIGRNLSNKITTGSCTPANFEDGAFFPTQTSGAATAGRAGQPEVQCVPRRGRELWVRLTLRR